MPKVKQILERTSAAQNIAASALGQVFSEPLPAFSNENLIPRRVLKTLREIMSATENVNAAKATLRPKLRRELGNLFDSYPKFALRLSDLNLRSIDELIDLLLETGHRVGYLGYTLKELRSKKIGLLGVFNGELFEVFVKNLRELQSDLMVMASGQLSDINEIIQSNLKNLLVDGRGTQVTIAGRFGRAKRAEAFYLWQGNQRRKYIDFGHVSELVPLKGGTSGKFTVLLSGEIKLPGAAKAMGPQVEAAQVRLQDADWIEFLVEGESEPQKVRPEDIIFSQRSIPRVGITTSMRGEQYRFSFTRGVYKESYLRVGVDVNAQALTRITSLLFP